MNLTFKSSTNTGDLMSQVKRTWGKFIERVSHIELSHADDVARSAVEIMCHLTMEDGTEPVTTEEHCTCWYDTAQVLDPNAVEQLQQAIDHLCHRGLLARHPINTSWVHPRFSAPRVEEIPQHFSDDYAQYDQERPHG